MGSTTHVMMKKKDEYFLGKKKSQMAQGQEPKLAVEGRNQEK